MKWGLVGASTIASEHVIGPSAPKAMRSPPS